MSPLPQFKPEHISPELEQRHRDAMLDLVLAWGALDGALGVLLSSLLGEPLAEGAAKIGKMPASKKMQRMQEILEDAPGGADAARIMRKHKKTYERFSKPRNRIAHTRCLGVWAVDPDYVVFQAFEKVADDQLALYRQPIQEMVHATRWGKALTEVALRAADAAIASKQDAKDGAEREA